MIYQILKFNLYQANVPFLNYLKTSENLMFSGGMEKEQWPEMGFTNQYSVRCSKEKEILVQQVLNESHYI